MPPWMICSLNMNTEIWSDTAFRVRKKKAVCRLRENRGCVEIVGYRDLTVDCALRSGATALIRGERIVGDHDGEMQASILNKQILEVRKARLSMATIPVPKEDMTYVSSSNVRGLCRLGEYIAAQRYVMPGVHALLMRHCLSERFVALMQANALSAAAAAEAYDDWYGHIPAAVGIIRCRMSRIC